MFRKKLIAIIALFSVIFPLIVSACAPASAEPVPSSAPAAASTTQSTVEAQPNTPAVQPAATSAATPSQEAVQTEPILVKLNLNSASADEFLTIPGMGNRMVREFQEYRPYISILQFRREIGKYVDDAQVADYEKYVFVPISINDADIETLQQIPGLDASAAQALIDGRPYTDKAAFLSKLAGMLSEADLAIAQTYLTD